MTIRNRHNPYLNDKLDKIARVKNKCLRCQKDFMALSKFNKICDPCKRQNEQHFNWPGRLANYN